MRGCLPSAVAVVGLSLLSGARAIIKWNVTRVEDTDDSRDLQLNLLRKLLASPPEDPFAFIGGYFDLDEVTKRLDEAKAGLKEAASADPVQLAMVSTAQMCLFDNFLESFQLNQLVAFAFDRRSYEFCQERAVAKASSFGLHCVKPLGCGSDCKGLAHNHFHSSSFFKIGWLKPLLVQFALQLSVKELVYMDVDNLELGDFLPHLQKSKSKRKGKILVNAENNQPRAANSGFLYASREALPCVIKWASYWRKHASECIQECEKRQESSCDGCLSDQDVIDSHKHCFATNDQDTFVNHCCGEDVPEPGPDALTFHVVGTGDKVKSLQAAGLWHPAVLTASDCDYEG